MTFSDRGSNNPTSVSATLGRTYRGGSGEIARSLVMPGLLALFGCYLVFGIITMEVPEGTAFPGPGFFPGLIAAGLFLFAVLLVVGDLRRRRSAPADDEADEPDGAHADDRADGRLSWSSLAWVVLGFLGFALTLNVLGWIIGAALLFWCVAHGFGEKRHLGSLIVGLTASSITYIAFDMLLGLSLPSGILGWEF
ncbi:tripartite tricarboxylate transporter TctB family protein [Microbacterium sp.]|uniref:tripartite tricarboxylate transporter TctB family protein n=1 Tax=Microbacterium sp. TaxID=51671 RepID=UPI003F95E2AE